MHEYSLQQIFAILYLWWLLVPAWFKLTLWAAGGTAVGYAAFRLQADGGRNRWLAPAACVAIYSVASAVVSIGPDYVRERERWLAQECREAMAAQRAKAAPIVAEGFLVAVDFDRLVNERFQRAAADVHPVFAALHASVFAAMAMRFLTENRLSYVEVEMLPLGRGEYSNRGRLQTEGWAGKRYRVYYLAALGDPGCVAETGETERNSSVSVGAPGVRAEPVAPGPRPYCIALDIRDTAMSRHRLAADEAHEILWGIVKPRGWPLPAFAGVRWERMQVSEGDSGAVVRRYKGFDYPEKPNRRHACHDPAALAHFVDATFQAPAQRSFLRSKPWYEGSAVQAFYEPQNAVAARPAQPQPVAVPAKTAGCAPDGRKDDAAVLVDRLNDFTAAATSVEVTMAQQRASSFTLERLATIRTVQWSAMVSSSDLDQTYTIRVLRDSGGLPGEAVYETEVKPSRRAAGRWSQAEATLILNADTPQLSLAAGEYWLAISPAPERRFFWTQAPGAQQPNCGFAAALRQPPSGWRHDGLPAADSGFSFRLVASD